MFRTSSITSLLLITSICLLGFQPGNALAHKVSHVTVSATFQTEPRTFAIEMAMEVDPTDDAVLNAQISPEQAATTFATEVLSLFFGDTELNITPKTQVIERKPEDIDPNFPDRTIVVATLAGDIPEAADYFTLHLSEDNEAAAIMVHNVDGKAGRRAEVLYPGEFSNPIHLQKTIKADPFTANANAGSGQSDDTDDSTQTAENLPEDDSNQTAAESDADSDAGTVVTPSLFYYIGFGFGHVLPSNYILLICLLTLFFFNRKVPLLIRQGSTFVIALCVGFSLSLLRAMQLGDSAELVPFLMLIGTAVLALENLFHEKLRWWRLVIIALTGIAYGIWLNELILSGVHFGDPLLTPTPPIVAAICLGMTLAVFLVFAILRLAMAGFRERPWYRKSVAFPASLIALGLALFWILLGS